MVKREKLKIIGKSVYPRDIKVFLGKKDITKNLRRLELTLDASQVNKAVLKIIPDEIDIDIKSEIENTQDYKITDDSKQLLKFIYTKQVKMECLSPNVLIKSFSEWDIPRIKYNLRSLHDGGFINMVWSCLSNEKDNFNFILTSLTPEGIDKMRGEIKGR